MDIHSSFLALFFATVAFFFFFLLKKKRRTSTSINLPPAPPWKLPIVGNMHQLFGRRPQHRTLRDLSRKYAPDLLRLRLGQVDHVVVSSLEAAKEVLHTHDLIFASRPRLMATEIIFYDVTDVAFNAYGSYWRHLRKICVLELLSARRVKTFAAIREEETSSTISSISSSSSAGRTANITELFRALSCTIVSRAAFGSRCAHADRFLEVVDKATAFLNGLSVSDLFPSLKFVDALTGASSSLQKIHREIDEMLDVIIEEHRAAKRDNYTEDEDVDQDLVDVLLGIQAKGELEFPLTMANIKAVILDLFVGGTETTAIVTVWAMAELMRHPEVMRIAQSEVREALKGKTKIGDGDTEELHYLKLVIKETLRLHPPGPLILPRICDKSCKVMGYDIAEGMRVLVNAWAIGRDSRYWDDAESFKPERFDGSRVDFRGGSFEFLPFGGGRRVCPGINYALANLEIFLASLLYHFDWELPDGMGPGDVDMTEMVGAAASRKLDLCLIAKPYICV